MKGNLQLQVPTPCHENWDDMKPEDQGRFCTACSKTVVDFSMMTDQEVLGFLAKAGAGVCGRFMPEQLNRNILPQDGRRRRAGWWHWLVAGLLVTAEAKGQTPKTIVGDSILYQIAPKSLDSPKAKVLDTVRVYAHGTTRCSKTVTETMTITGGEVFHVYKMKRTVTEWTADTLATAGLLPKRELAVYPNPARRGTVVTLQWQRTDPGTYEVCLFNAVGELVERRQMEVGGKEQVDLLNLPPALPAGMYFLRAARPGGAKVITLRIIVV